MSSAYTFRCFIYNPAVKEADNVVTFKTLKVGSKGSGVKTLQKDLNKLGYKLTVDGDFGAKTEAAVKNFQKKKGLTVDGKVGSKTNKAIIKALEDLAKKK